MNYIEKDKGAQPGQEKAPSNDNNHYNATIFNLDKTCNRDAEEFLNTIAEDESITFQTFDDTKSRHDSALVHVLHGNLNQHLQFLTELNEKGAGIFFTVNLTDLKGRAAKNILKIRALFIDLDGALLGPVQSGPLAPHIIVETSPKRFHAYWLVEDIPLEVFSCIQKELIKRFNSDTSVHDLPRVMRLPGFYHQKGEPYLVKVIENTKAKPYKSQDFFNAFQIDLNKFKKSRNSKILTNDLILQELDRRGMVKRQSPSINCAWEIKCPFSDQHTTGDDGTVYFESNTNGYANAAFKCQHAHCVDRKIEDLRKFLNLDEIWNDPIPIKAELLPVDLFQEDMFPDALRPWIMDIADRMQISPDFLTATCVVVLGSLIGRKIAIFPKAHDDWLVIPNLWGAIIGRPSSLKSPAISEIMKPLEELIKRADINFQKEKKDLEQKEMWLEAQKCAQKDKMKKAAKDAADEMPKFDNLEAIAQPILKRYKTEDGTIEKIGEILLTNPQGILIHRDELMGWLKGLDKYGHEGDRAFFLESWNGNGSFTVDRIGRGTLHIPALCLSIIGGIQPGPLGLYVYQAANGGGGDDGLLQRFQILVWPDTHKQWKNVDRPPNVDARDKAYKVFFEIDAFEPFEPDGDFKIKKINFASDAQILFNEWWASLEHKLRNIGLDVALENHLAKYRSLMPSLALIFYIVETVGKGEDSTAVDAKATQQAIRWCDYLETHAKRLYASGKDPYIESARALLDRIKRGDLTDNFSSREIYFSKHWSKLDTADRVNNAIKILEDFGWIKTKEIKTSGRSTNIITVHPRLKELL